MDLLLLRILLPSRGKSRGSLASTTRLVFGNAEMAQSSHEGHLLELIAMNTGSAEFLIAYSRDNYARVMERYDGPLSSITSPSMCVYIRL